MNKNFIICLVAFLLASCSQRFYSSGGNNIPAFSKDKQLNAGGGFHITEKGTGVQIQTAYAATHHIGFMLNGHLNTVSSVKSTNNVEETDQSNASYMEGALGFYFPSEHRTSFETFAGAGFGRIKNNFGPGSSLITNSRYFVQPSYTFFINNQELSISLALRLSYLDNRIKDFTDGGQGNYIAKELKLLEEKPKLFFMEPSFQLRMGKKHQGVLQVTFCSPLTTIGYRFDRMNIGFGYNISLK